MSETITCYRFVTDDLKSQNGDEQWTIGEWKKANGELELCKTGLHACKTPYQSLNYVYGNRWFKAEARGRILEGDDKFCSSEMRLVKEIPITVIHQWAIDCAYRVLPIYEQEYPNDMRPRRALEAKQAWINNPCEETAWATKDAASDAWDTTWNVWIAARNVWVAAKRAADAATAAVDWVAKYAAKHAACYAWCAVKSAADAAAWATAEATTYVAEVKWQRKHLEELIQKTMEDNT